MAFSSISFQFLTIPTFGDSLTFSETLKNKTFYEFFVNEQRLNSFEVSKVSFVNGVWNSLTATNFKNSLLLDYIFTDYNFSVYSSYLNDGLGTLQITAKYDNALFICNNINPNIIVTIRNFTAIVPVVVPPVVVVPASMPIKNYFQYLNLNGDLKTRGLSYDVITKTFTIPEILEDFFITDVFLNSARCNYISLLYDDLEMEAYINTLAKSYKPNKYSYVPAYTVFSMLNFTPVTSSSFNTSSIALPVSIFPKIEDNPDYQYLYALATSTQHNYFDSNVGVVKVYPICSQGFLLTGTKFQPSRKVLFYCSISVIATTCTLNILDTGNTFVPTPAIKNIFQNLSNLTSMISGFIAVLEPIV